MAESSFEIPDAASAVTLVNDPGDKRAARTGFATFTVTNRTGQPLSCRLKAIAVNDAQVEWFSVQGEAERGFAASETQKVTVGIVVPAGVSGGDNYGFRLQGHNVNRTSDATESAIITVIVPEAEPTEQRNWIPWAVAAALLLLVGGFVGWKLWAPSAVMPDVSEGALKYAAAEKIVADALTKAGRTEVSVTRVEVEATGKDPETVIAQSPKAGARLPGGSGKITLSVDPGVEVPPIRRRVWNAETQAMLVGFTPKVSTLYRQTQFPDYTVLLSDPEPGARVAKGSVVSLVIGRTCANRVVCSLSDVRPPGGLTPEIHQ